jgi:hypothetical protein
MSDFASSGSPIYKNSFIETTTPLGANGTFTGPWHDSIQDGIGYVFITSISNVVNIATTGIQLQTSEDLNAVNGVSVAIQGASSVNRIAGIIRQRYWRIVYTNGIGAQAFFTIYVTVMNFIPQGNNLTGNSADAVGIFLPVSFTTDGDNQNVNGNVLQIPNSVGASGPLLTEWQIYTGAFTGTPNVALQGFSRPRTPSVFKRVSTVAAGNTAIWTPGAGNKFRLLKYQIEVTANAALAVAGVLTISLFDGAAGDIAQDHQVFVPGAAGAAFGIDDFIDTDLGQFGILSSAANNVMNVNLSVALTAGTVNVIVMGTEE